MGVEQTQCGGEGEDVDVEAQWRGTVKVGCVVT